MRNARFLFLLLLSYLITFQTSSESISVSNLGNEEFETSEVSIPNWIFKIQTERRRLFLLLIEPIIVFFLGPCNKKQVLSSNLNLKTPQKLLIFGNESISDELSRRNLGFLPSYIEDVSVFRDTSMSFATLSMMFVIMSSVMIVFISCFYHNQKTSPLFISPRRHRLPKLVPPPLPVDGPLSWARVCLFMSDEEIINRVGYDSLIFIRFHRLGLRCIVKMSVFAFLVILPMNFTGGGHANASDLKGMVGTLLFTDFLRFTMANVNGGSPRLIVHCFSAYLLTAIVCRELLVEYNAFNSIRHRYLLSREPHLRTVLVSNIPRHLRTSKKISTYFRNVYPDAVRSVTLCQNLIKLERLVEERTSVLAKIERELLVLCRYEKRRLVGQTRFEQFRTFFSCWNMRELLFCCNGSHERLSKLYNKLEDLNIEVEKEHMRRHQVMKRLDKMEAGKGRKDNIDYLLASPFLGIHPEMRNIGLRISTPTDYKGSYDPPALSKGNKDLVVPETVPEALHPNEVECDPQLGGDDDQPFLYDTETGELRQPNGPFLRPSNNETDIFDKEQSPKQEKVGVRPFCKAKQAIQRYSRNKRRTSILGKPSSSSHSPRNKNEVLTATNEDGNIEDHTNEVTDKAFVVMRTFTASTIAIQSMHSAMPGAMQVTTAPEPRDILWKNIYLSKGAKRTRFIFAEAIVFLIYTMYIVPVALVCLLVSESALISSSPRLAQLDQASALFSSAIALIQPLCIVGLQQLLPPLFMVIGRAEGLRSFSEVQLSAFSRYFLFQVINVFVVTAIAGSVFDTIAIIVENPEAAFEMLGNALPRMSSFFTTLVVMKTFLGLGVELVRTMSIIQSCLRYILFPMPTLREQRSVRLGMRAIDDPGWFPFHKVLAQDMLVVVISVVFAVVAPLVLLASFFFFLFSRIMWTHHLLYVYESVFETGGLFWPKIFRRYVFGLLIAQATITGQFFLKEARHEAYATLVLMGLTYFFLRATRKRYDQASYTLPLEVATVMDISVGQEEEVNHDKHLPTDNEKVVKFSNESYDPSATNYAPFDPTSSLGKHIGKHDPFEMAYIQPVLRADPTARPEQPFPPAQLGREDKFLKQNKTKKDCSCNGSTQSSEGGSAPDTTATVRLKSLNREDRKVTDQWWNEQLQRSEKQHWLRVLIGEEGGTLLIGGKTRLMER